MSAQFKKFVMAVAAVVTSASLARAEIVIHEMGSTAANTFTTLGRYFVIGCSILAAGLVIAKLISSKK